MTVVLSHTTACSYWRHYAGKAPTRVRIKPELPDGPTIEYATLAVSDLAQEAKGNVKLLVKDSSQRRRTKQWTSYVTPAGIPADSYCRISRSLGVVSPEMSFWQMSKALPFVHLVQYGIELCSTYAIREDEMGFVQRKPITSPKKLSGFLDRISSTAKTKTARDALRWVGAGSASPRETALFMLLCLPYRYGGYAIPIPTMNHQIDLSSAQRRIAKRGSFRCDLYWPDKLLDVEYDSTLFHTAEERIESDSIRRNVLGDLDIRVITITRRQLSNIMYFDDVAREIAAFVGKNIRTDEAAFLERRIKLRTLVFRERLNY